MFGLFRKNINPPKESHESSRGKFMGLIARCQKADKMVQIMIGDAINMANTAFIQRFGSVDNFRKQPNSKRVEYIRSLVQVTKDPNVIPEHHLGFILFLSWAGAISDGEEELAQDYFKELMSFSKLGELVRDK